MGIFFGLAGIRLEWLPVLSLGFFIGLEVRGNEPRGDWRLGITAILLTLPCCLLADLLLVWMAVGMQMGGSGPPLDFHPQTLRLIVLDKWGLPDFLAYCCAAVESYHFATRRRKIVSPSPNTASPSGRFVALVVLGIVLLFVLICFNWAFRVEFEGLALSPDGRTLVAAQSLHDTQLKKWIVFWDLPQGRRSIREQASVGRLAWSRDSRLLAVIANADATGDGERGRVIVWRRGQDTPLARLSGHQHYVTCLSFSPAGRLLATGNFDGTVKLWDTRTFAERASLQEEETVHGIAFSKDGRLLAVGLGDGTLALWDVRTASRSKARQAHQAAISTVLFSPDGKLFSAGGVDATVKVWAPATLEEQAAYRLPMGWITCLTLSPDGQTLAVSGGSFRRPGEVKLLETTTGREIHRFEVHANTVCAAIFTRDGKTLIAATVPPISPFVFPRDGQLYRWDVASGQLLDPLD